MYQNAGGFQKWRFLAHGGARWAARDHLIIENIIKNVYKYNKKYNHTPSARGKYNYQYYSLYKFIFKFLNTTFELKYFTYTKKQKNGKQKNKNIAISLKPSSRLHHLQHAVVASIRRADAARDEGVPRAPGDSAWRSARRTRDGQPHRARARQRGMDTRLNVVHRRRRPPNLPESRAAQRDYSGGGGGGSASASASGRGGGRGGGSASTSYGWSTDMEVRP